MWIYLITVVVAVTIFFLLRYLSGRLPINRYAHDRNATQTKILENTCDPILDSCELLYYPFLSLFINEIKTPSGQNIMNDKVMCKQNAKNLPSLLPPGEPDTDQKQPSIGPKSPRRTPTEGHGTPTCLLHLLR